MIGLLVTFYDLRNQDEGERSGRADESDSTLAREIHHSSNADLVGPDGNARTIFTHNTPSEEMAVDIRKHIAAETFERAAALA